MSNENKFQLLDGNEKIKHWTEGVQFEEGAKTQVRRTALLPFVKQVCVMPDCHAGRGSTVGSVIATSKAIIPAAVGVDIGCGVVAVRTTLTSNDLGDSAKNIYTAIHRAVPVGENTFKDSDIPENVKRAWEDLEPGYRKIVDKYGKCSVKNVVNSLATMGQGNHTYEVSIDENDNIWLLIHSGSRGIGNRIGTIFTEIARKDMEKNNVHLPDYDLSYFEEGSEHFNDYIHAMLWAQSYAYINRQLMIENSLQAIRKAIPKKIKLTEETVNIHHNYAIKEIHFGEELWVTRKGATSAKENEVGVILSSMGTPSYIVRGKGNNNSLHSCSHGAGRVMSRGEAKRTFTLEMHRKSVEGIVCRTDKGVIDETPAAYKNIDAVMSAQTDLVDPIHRLKQIVCVKG